MKTIGTISQTFPFKCLVNLETFCFQKIFWSCSTWVYKVDIKVEFFVVYSVVLISIATTQFINDRSFVLCLLDEILKIFSISQSQWALLTNLCFYVTSKKKQKYIEKSSSTFSMFNAHVIILYMRQFIWFVDGWMNEWMDTWQHRSFVQCTCIFY